MAKKNNSIDGGFIVVPKRTIRCEEFKKLKPTTKVVYQTLLTEFIRDKKRNPKNKVKMSISQIASISTIGRTTVWRSLHILESCGFLKISQQGGLENNPSEYELEGRFLW